MTAPAQPVENRPGANSPSAAAAAQRPERGPRLRLARVHPPQPPLEDGPARLVLPGVPVPRPPHRPGPRPHPARAPYPDADFGPAWSSRAELPDPRTAGRRLILLTLEVLGGRRPTAQLRPLTSPGLYAALTRGRAPRWCAARAPLALGPVHVCEPVDGVAEVSAVVRLAGRAHAVAARLEGVDGRWRATALQVG